MRSSARKLSLVLRGIFAAAKTNKDRVDIVFAIPETVGSPNRIRLQAPGPAPQNMVLPSSWPMRIIGRRIFIIVFGIPIRNPFPDIPGHVLRAIRTGSTREGARRRSFHKAITIWTALDYISIELRFVIEISPATLKFIPPGKDRILFAARGF